ncbi:hypothetical protein C5167_045395 [Papaver somniferum]|uniref:TF-B3 domain-containing protein n=1 Tax=Papaver somniferum TaxID=3469 RepID=A0A4Y7LEL6_PAPSO|nr:hypothetical protein C5167_045395 [Papaver somniferum]
MAKGTCDNNSYEEARKQRLEENKKRFEDLGIAKITKTLSEFTKMGKESPGKKQVKPRSRTAPTSPDSLRRSSRPRSTAISYQEEYTDHSLLTKRSRSRVRSSSASSSSYIARPLEEIKVATRKERCAALKCAESFESNLQSKHPSFVKSMLRSHVVFQPNFVKATFQNQLKLDMVLEDEEGLEYEAVYIPERTGISGGWRAFALDHKLDDGDAVVFERTEAARFKVYIFKGSNGGGKVNAKEMKRATESKTLKLQKVKKSDENDEDADDNMSKEKDALEAKARGKKARKSEKVIKSDTDNCASEEELMELTGDGGRKARSSKKLRKSGTNADMGEEDLVQISKQQRTTRNSKKAEDCDISGVRKIENSVKAAEPAKEINGSVSRRLQLGRHSKRVAKTGAEEGKTTELVDVAY